MALYWACSIRPNINRLRAEFGSFWTVLEAAAAHAPGLRPYHGRAEIIPNR